MVLNLRMDTSEESDSLEQSRTVAAAIGSTTWQLEVEPVLLEAETEVVDLPTPEVRSISRASRTPRLMPNQPPTVESPPQAERILEALLFVGGPPLTLDLAGQVIRGFSVEQLQHCFEELNQQYRRQNRPYTIQMSEAGYQLVERPQYRNIKERLFGGPREARLSPIALDILSLVAYRQPISKTDLDALRGIDCGATLKQLVRLGLLILNRGSESSEPSTYQTTSRFLELFGLSSLEELPKLGDTIR
jgi:segregation and condensation protein B